MSYALEVRMIAKGPAPRAMVTDALTVFCESRRRGQWPRQAPTFDVCHLGLTTGGGIGAETRFELSGWPGIVDRLGGRCA